jgi:hypothetical protein
VNRRVPAGLVEHQAQVSIRGQVAQRLLAPHELGCLALDRASSQVMELVQHGQCEIGPKRLHLVEQRSDG